MTSIECAVHNKLFILTILGVRRHDDPRRSDGRVRGVPHGDHGGERGRAVGGHQGRPGRVRRGVPGDYLLLRQHFFIILFQILSVFHF